MFEVNLRKLMEAGVHFGHQTGRWNPKMKQFIFGARNGVHIVDLDLTLAAFKRAYQFIVDTVAAGDSVLFVGTKRQAQPIIEEAAKKCEMPMVIHRWLGGMLTNFNTLRASMERLERLEGLVNGTIDEGRSKKELARLGKEVLKLRRNLGGVLTMKKLPGAIFVIDSKNEHLAIKEAQRLGIPIIAVVDTNCDPDGIDYVIPGNDDAIKSIELMCQTVADACLDGKEKFEARIQQESRERMTKQQTDAKSDAPKAAAPAGRGERGDRGDRRPRRNNSEEATPAREPKVEIRPVVVSRKVTTSVDTEDIN